MTQPPTKPESWVKAPAGTTMQLLCGRCRQPMPAAGRKRMWKGTRQCFGCIACQQAKPHLIVAKAKP